LFGSHGDNLYCFVVRSNVKCHFSADVLVFAQTAGDIATESV